MVLDIMMPTMDGWAVLEAMTELPREQRPGSSSCRRWHR